MGSKPDSPENYIHAHCSCNEITIDYPKRRLPCNVMKWYNKPNPSAALLSMKIGVQQCAEDGFFDSALIAAGIFIIPYWSWRPVHGFTYFFILAAVANFGIIGYYP